MNINLENSLIFKEEPMKNHTSFRIGGVVDYFISIGSIEDLIKGIKYVRKRNIPYEIIGNGSNILFGDKPYNGVIFSFGGEFSKMKITDTLIKVEAGALLSKISSKAKDNSLSGMEGLSGIPGTIGGAVSMNAGAYGYEIKDLVVEVECLDENLNIINLKNKDLDFSYRNSRVLKEELIVLSVTLKLEKGSKEEIENKITDFRNKRNEKQPIEFPSGGSTFKRPEGYYSGALIEECGLKGKRIGGAEVSKKHAGFIINNNNATGEDVINLIKCVKEEVYKKFNINLCEEIRILGNF